MDEGLPKHLWSVTQLKEKFPLNPGSPNSKSDFDQLGLGHKLLLIIHPPPQLNLLNFYKANVLVADPHLLPKQCWVISINNIALGGKGEAVYTLFQNGHRFKFLPFACLATLIALVASFKVKYQYSFEF